MSDSILKLRVESSEYDSKLKKAAEGIRHLAEVAHKGGGDLAGLEKAELDYIRALGDMETQSKTAAGSTRELENAFKELTVIYNNLNDVEKADEGGKALAASLATLKQRALDARDGLDKATKALKPLEEEAKESSGLMDELSKKMVISVDAAKLLDLGLKALKAGFDVVKDAIFASESNIDEWGRTVQSSEAAYSVFLQTLNTGNWSHFLTNLETAVRGARQLYDALDRLGSIKSNNQAAIAIVQQQIAQLRLAKQQGQNVDDQLKKATANLAKLQNQSVAAGKNAGRTMAAETIKNRFNAQGGNLAGSSANAVVDRIMKTGQAEFDRQAKILDRLTKKGTTNKSEVMTTKYGTTYMGPATPKFDISRLSAEEQKQYKLAKAITEGETEIQKGISTFASAVQEGTSAAREELKGNRYAASGNSKPGKNGKNGKDTKQEMTELQQNQKQINDLTQKYVDLRAKGVELNDDELVYLQEEIKRLEARNGQLRLYAEQLQGRLLPIDASLSTEGVSKRGGNGLSYSPDLSKPAQINDKGMKSLEKNIEKQTKMQAKEMKNENKEKKSVAEGFGDLAGGMSSMVSGLEQLGIDIPEGLQGVIGGIQAVSGILTSIMTIVSAIQAIAGADALIPFKNGGIVPHAATGMLIPGTDFADRTPILASSGEVVLNRAQTGNLASQLQGNAFQNARLSATIRGEQIRLAVNNNGRRTGRGETVTTNKL